MTIKLAILLIALLFVGRMPVAAQPPHSCGLALNFAVTYAKVDAAGYAPRAAAGSETVFNCIAARDPYFSTQRFASAWEALNYWFILYGQELGVMLSPLPPPTN